MENLLDNSGQAPVVPAGTESTIYGTQHLVDEEGEPVSVPKQEQPVAQQQQTIQEEAPTMEEEGKAFEELMAKKGFRTPNDFAKSYSELEKANTQKAMDISELSKVKSEAMSPSQLAIQQVQDQNPDMSQDEAVRIVNKLIADQVAPIKEQLELQKTFKNPEDMRYATQVAEIIKKNPNTPWGIALDAVKFQTSQESLKQQGKNEAYQTIQQNQSGLTTDPGVQARGKEVDVSKIVSDRNVPLDEVRKILKEQVSQ
jgi:hypothetical protein